MIKKFTKHFLLAFMVQLLAYHAIAQAPNITYSSPQDYKLNVPVIPLKPVNTGGSVPLGEYGAVSTFAGTGQYGYTDGAPNIATFKIPTGLVIDKDNNLYVSDFTNYVIRKITPQGTVSTFAGSGSTGRDNGTATQASFYGPGCMSLTSSGVMYVLDQTGQTVRQITPAANVSLLAGSGLLGKANGNGAAASFNTPSGVAIGPDNNLYISDLSNYVIRKITPAGDVSNFLGNGIISSANGSGTQVSFGAPQGLAFDSKGNLYVCDVYARAIRKIGTDGVVTTFAGNGNNVSIDGTGTSAGFKYPAQMAFDSNDDLYVSDDNLIRKITPQGVVTTVAGSPTSGLVDGVGASARLSTPACLAFDKNGFLFVAEISNHVIRKVTLTGYIIDKPLPPGLMFDSETGTISGTPTALTPATDYTITARNKSGMNSTTVRIGVSNITAIPTSPPKIDYASPQIYTINKAIAPLVPTNTGGDVEPNGFSIDKPLPAGLSLNLNTGVISGKPTQLSPATIYKVTARNAAGPNIAVINIKISDEILTIAAPPDISYTTTQTLYLKTPITPIIPNNNGGDVLRYSNGLVKNFAGTGHPGRNNGPKDAAEFDTPIKVTIDAAGNFYVTDFNNYALRKMTPDGNFSTLTGYAGPGYTNGAYGTSQLQGPRGVVTDKAGNVYAADTYSIRKVTPAGITSTLAGSSVPGYVDGNGTTARFDGVFSLAMDNSDNIYAVDQVNRRIRKITLAGAVTTIAGNSTFGSVDGQGTQALFSNPQDIVFVNGNFFIADYTTIRKMTPGGLVTTIAGNGQPKVLNGPALSGGFGNASAIGVNAAGDIYVLDIGNNAPNEGNAILRRIDKDNNLSTVSLMDATGIRTYLSVPNSLTFDKNGLIYVASGSNYLQTVSFDRYTIDKALPVGLIFDTGSGQISGTPTVLSPETSYTITAYNSGGPSTTVLKLKVVPNETKIANVITFPNFANPSVWDANYNIDPKVTSQQAETPIILTSSNPAVATINPDNTLHILSAGQTTIIANQAGNDFYLPADAISHTLTITKIGPTLTFPDITEKTLCDADFNSAGESNNTAIPITYTSSKPEVATVDQAGLVHIVGVGSTNIVAHQNETALYYESPTVTRVLTVNSSNTQIPAPTASISIPNFKIYEGETAKFTATTNGSAAGYQWQVNGNNAGTNTATFSTNTLQNDDRITCIITFTERCVLPVASNIITIQVLPPPVTITPPNTFTPNGDGINDTWKIPALANYPDCTVRIFNRNGTEVSLSRGYSKAWDGTYGGRQLPAGVYYYVITPGDGQRPLSGNVTILK